MVGQKNYLLMKLEIPKWEGHFGFKTAPFDVSFFQKKHFCLLQNFAFKALLLLTDWYIDGQSYILLCVDAALEK